MRNSTIPQDTTAVQTDHKIKGWLEALYRLVGGDATFYQTDSLSWVKEVEDAYVDIRKELDQVLLQKDIPAWDSVSADPNVRMGSAWKTYIFSAYGQYVEDNCTECPATFQALKTIPGLTTAWFSILEPQTALPEHEGPYNGVLRYHLGLKIPSSDPTVCGIRVGKDTRYWTEGKSLLFDDTHSHEAWNLTDEIRVVLFVDVVRPLPFPVSIINKLAIKYAGRSAFVNDLIQNVRKRNKTASKT